MDITDIELVRLIKDRFPIYKSDGMILAHIPDELWEKSRDQPKQEIRQADKTSKIMIFTDGGCTDNGGKNPSASWSFVVFNGKTELYRNSAKVVQGQYGDEAPSNNRGELTAILRALEYVESTDLRSDVTIYSDSNISVKTINEWYQTWVTKKVLHKHANIKLITPIMDLYNKLSAKLSIKVSHCKAHQAEPSDKNSIEWLIWKGNDVCDKMCSVLL